MKRSGMPGLQLWMKRCCLIGLLVVITCGLLVGPVAAQNNGALVFAAASLKDAMDDPRVPVPPVTTTVLPLKS